MVRKEGGGGGYLTICGLSVKRRRSANSPELTIRSDTKQGSDFTAAWVNSVTSLAGSES